MHFAKSARSWTRLARMAWWKQKTWHAPGVFMIEPSALKVMHSLALCTFFYFWKTTYALLNSWSKAVPFRFVPNHSMFRKLIQRPHGKLETGKLQNVLFCQPAMHARGSASINRFKTLKEVLGIPIECRICSAHYNVSELQLQCIGPGICNKTFMHFQH